MSSEWHLGVIWNPTQREFTSRNRYARYRCPKQADSIIWRTVAREASRKGAEERKTAPFQYGPKDVGDVNSHAIRYAVASETYRGFGCTAQAKKRLPTLIEARRTDFHWQMNDLHCALANRLAQFTQGTIERELISSAHATALMFMRPAARSMRSASFACARTASMN